MAGLIPRGSGYVCRSCQLRQFTTPLLLQSRSNLDTPKSTSQYLQSRRTASTRAPISRPSRVTAKQATSNTSTPSRRPEAVPVAQPAAITTSEVPINPEDVRGTLREMQSQINRICASTHLPEDVHVLEVMDRAYQFANLLVFGQTTAPDEEVVNLEEEDERADNNLFSELDEPAQTSRKQVSPSTAASSLPTSYRERSAQTLSESIYTLLKDPKVHISTPLLSTYVRIICQLGNPEYLPEIFFLYANKPQPVPGSSSPIQYRNPSPSSPKNAVPQELSDVALDTAILQRDLALAVAIIDTTVGTRAFRLSKFVKKASLPVGLVATTPVAAYAAADWVANWQNSLDPQMAKAITLMATAAYVGTLTTIGFVAVTTWNDHHERVRWMEGTPLRQRWMREEERLYFDRIAMAWGFQRKRRRGEEMGGLWEELREECGIRGMVLDKSDLLPGMQ